MEIDHAQQEEIKKQWNQMVARAWTDAAFKQRLLAEPSTVLAEQGIEFPSDIEVRVHEGSPYTIHLMLPPAPVQ
jgi:nitrile hydratase